MPPELREAIPVHSTDTVSSSWDAAAMQRRIPSNASENTLRAMYAHVDPAGDPTSKSSYSLPHHMVSDSGNIGPANTKACSNAMGSVANLTGGDQQGAMDHLAAHMADAGMANNSTSDDDIERRSIAEIRMVEGEAGPTISGYAAKFNSLSENLGGFREIIMPGAFGADLVGADIRLLIEHDGLPLARTTSGTLTVTEDDIGLAFSAPLDATDPDVQRILPKIKRGDLSQMSFGFRVLDDKWETDNGDTIRKLLRATLNNGDVSVVTYPAYPATTVAVRALDMAKTFRAQGSPEENEEESRKVPVSILRRKLDLI